LPAKLDGWIRRVAVNQAIEVDGLPAKLGRPMGAVGVGGCGGWVGLGGVEVMVGWC
jgi:hypothetical protein